MFQVLKLLFRSSRREWIARPKSLQTERIGIAGYAKGGGGLVLFVVLSLAGGEMQLYLKGRQRDAVAEWKCQAEQTRGFS